MSERRTDQGSTASPGDEDKQKHSILGRTRRPKDDAATSVARVRGGDSTRVDPPTERTVRRPIRAPRQARLRITHVDPWSVTKAAFVLSIVLGIVAVVAVFIVWTVLGAAGLWDAINSAMAQTLGDTEGQAFRVEDYVGTGRAVGFTMIVAVVDVVLLTMIATLGAFLYNLTAALLGGIEVTLTEED